MLFVFVGLAGLVLLLFFYLYFKRPHSIWLGFWALAAFFSFLFIASLLVFTFIKGGKVLYDYIIPALLLLFAVLVLLFVLLLFIVPIASGIRLVKREGFSRSHLLSIAFGVFYFLYLTLWPFVAIKGPLGTYIYSLLSGFIAYLAFVFLLYTLSAFLNMFPHQRQAFDYIVVLGSGLIKGEVPPLLASRIDKALTYTQNHHLTPTYVFSGGQGWDEPRAEAEAMAQYALNKGLDPNCILKEDQSTSTAQNIAFSTKMIEADFRQSPDGKPPKVLVVTTRYHVFRALLIAKKQGLFWQGLGSKTKFYFSLNAFLREYIAYLSLTKKSHLMIGGILLLFRLFSTNAVQRWLSTLI